MDYGYEINKISTVHLKARKILWFSSVDFKLTLNISDKTSEFNNIIIKAFLFKRKIATILLRRKETPIFPI